MRVRRVRLPGDGLSAQPCAVRLEEPSARRPRACLGARVRVRSFLLRPDGEDVRETWGAAPESPPGGVEAVPSRATGEGPSPGDLLPVLRELLRPSVRAVLSREDWPHPLYSYQEQGVLFLYERPAALLADEMGLGKTAQALAAAGLLLSTGVIEQVLVLCPAPLLSYWAGEAVRWMPRLRGAVAVVRGPAAARFYLWHSHAPVVLAGYETLRADLEAGRLPVRPWDLVVLDEAQRIKNAESGIARACKALPRRRAWALTGTPLENRLEDYLSLLEFLTARPATGLETLRTVREAQAALQLRRRKEDVALQLPPKTVVDVTLEMGEAQASAYRRLEQDGVLELRERGEGLRVEHVLALLTRLKQVANFCPVTGASVKLEFLRERLEELSAEGRQALVFSQFADERAGAARLARELGPGVEAYHGDLDAGERDRRLHRFQAGETRVLAMSLRTGGVGLNLQQASAVFHFDRWWNPAVEWQAEDRTHRLGQSLPVTVYRLMTSGSVEARVHAVLAGKESLIREVLEGEGAGQSSALTLDELFRLLDLPAPADASIGEGVPSAEGEA